MHELHPSVRSRVGGLLLTLVLPLGACSAGAGPAAATSGGTGGSTAVASSAATTSSATGAGGAGGAGPILGRRPIAAGATHTCAILADGTVRCWGGNQDGQLGDGTTIDSAVPVVVQGVSSAKALDAGDHHTCAVLEDGTARCWGKNDSFELGDGTHTSRPTAVAVTGLAAAVLVALGTSYEVEAPGHGCAILEDGTVRCWGNDANGELGDGQTEGRAGPKAAIGLTHVVAISSYGPWSCAALADGTLWEWGNASGVTPQALGGGVKSAIDVAAGLTFACALLADGTVRCWGHNYEGQLGQGGPGLPDSPTPVVLAGVSDAVALGAGSDHTCAVLADGTMRCWGWGADGQLGNGEHGIRTPVAVVGVTDAAAVAGGEGHTCAMLKDRTVRCWGANARGQLGDGTTSERLVPVEPKGL